jgi:hypothetical protein
MKPNIFEISTKELTQDGFITWLLQWADPSNKGDDEKLNQCAMDFINDVLMKQYKEKIEIIKVGAGRQWKNIDIWADVNEKYRIIIEDKTYTSEHSNQLERYKTDALEWCKENNRELICVYLKIGTEAKKSLEIVKEKGFVIVGRNDLISFFSKYDINNDIFKDFVSNIIKLEESEKAFETKAIDDWDWSCWIGFYNYLDSILTDKDSEWKYVANPSGGFLGFWWHFPRWKEYCVYLQIEQGKLCFKIGEVYENHKQARNEWYNILIQKSLEKGKKEIKKASRFGSGTYMTVAIIEREDWLGNDNEIINKDKVIDKLKEYEHFLDYCLE